MKTELLDGDLIRWRLADIGRTAAWLSRELDQSESLTSLQLNGHRLVDARTARRISLILSIPVDRVVVSKAAA